MLDLQKIGKTFTRGPKSVRALDGVSLSLNAGEFIAIQGHSGSGKSTLLMVAAGLLTPSEGKAVFEGKNIYNLNPSERAQWRAKTVGFVFQQFHLFPYLSAIDNVLTATLASPLEGGLEKALVLLKRFGLGDRVEHLPSELSVGEQQRVALARALLHSPRLLLCDEPTGNLDEVSARTVIDALIEFRAAGGAVLLVTHDASVAGRAQRTIHMKNGQMI